MPRSPEPRQHCPPPPSCALLLFPVGPSLQAVAGSRGACGRRAGPASEGAAPFQLFPAGGFPHTRHKPRKPNAVWPSGEGGQFGVHFLRNCRLDLHIQTLPGCLVPVAVECLTWVRLDHKCWQCCSAPDSGWVWQRRLTGLLSRRRREVLLENRISSEHIYL